MQTATKPKKQQSPKEHHHHHHHRHHHRHHGRHLRAEDLVRNFQAIQYDPYSKKLIKPPPKERSEKPSAYVVDPLSKYKYAPLEVNTVRRASKNQPQEDLQQENEIPPNPEHKKHQKHHHRQEETELLLLISPKKNGKSNSVETIYDKRKVTFESLPDVDESRDLTTEPEHKKLQSYSEEEIRAKFRHFSQTPTTRAIEVAKLLEEKRSKHKSVAESQKTEKNEERPEYASNPREFTKSGCPIPFWQLEMKKGPEYLVRLHRHYGKRNRHERAPVYKPDLDVVSINTVDSNTTFENNFDDIYHDALIRLIPLDRIFLFHRVEITKGIFLSQTSNDYHILNHHGHILYRVREEIKFKCYKKVYTFCDYWGKEFMQLNKTGRKYQIFCPPGTGVGFVVPHFKIPFQTTKASIHDENQTELIQFEKLPQKLTCDKSQDCIFEYQSVRGQGPLGMITKKLANLKMSNFSEHDNYGIKIHSELSPNIKATVMAAWFIIYKLHYEGKTHREIHHNLTKGAKHLFADVKPSTEELPHKLIGDIVLTDREDDQQ